MFRGTLEEQKAATEELRQIALHLSNVEHRLIMLKPHLSNQARLQYKDQWQKHVEELGTAGENLTRIYDISIDHLEDAQ